MKPLFEANGEKGDFLKREQALIIGIDPGTTTAIAFADIDGKILDVLSGKGISKDELIYEISERGVPLIIATDKARMPEAVHGIKRKYKCILFAPEKDMPRKEKFALAKNVETRNGHEVDAVAAALKAYNHYDPKLRQMRRQEGAGFREQAVKRLLSRIK
ncbi:MAG: DUF460 domain-containing protein [Candidatus Micrarchaeota archaeon]